MERLHQQLEGERQRAERALKVQSDAEKAQEDGELRLKNLREQANEALRQAWEELEHTEQLLCSAAHQAWPSSPSAVDMQMPPLLPSMISVDEKEFRSMPHLL